MIVVDSSAIVAMMFNAPTAAALAARLATEPLDARYLSAANYVEVGAVLAGRRRDPLHRLADLDAFVELARLTLAPVDERQARLALETRVKFGRSFGASAGMNFGDCFAYALAKSLRAPLLFVGDDFAATDVESAL